MRLQLASLLLALSLPASVHALSAVGSSSIELKFTSLQSSAGHPLHAEDSVTLWCALDRSQLTISNATFFRPAYNLSKTAEISENGKNATLFLKNPTILDAGEYECKLYTTQGTASYKTHIYARPVAHPHGGDLFDTIEGKDNHLQALTYSIEAGSAINITCPAIGHPSPVVSWSKDGKSIKESDKTKKVGKTIIILDADQEAAGVYTCEAKNEFKVGGKPSTTSLLVVDKELRVKDFFAWLIPLIVIIVMFILLVTIILICEIRRRKHAYESADQE